MTVLNYIDVKDLSNEVEPDFQNVIPSDEILNHILGFDRPISVPNLFNNTTIDATILDFSSFPAFGSDQEIIQFVYKKTGIDISGPLGINKINTLFRHAVNIYQKRYLKKLPQSLQENSNSQLPQFRSTAEIIGFLKDTRNNTVYRFLNCAISKISFGVHDILNSHIFQRHAQLGKAFMEKLSVPVQIVSGYDEEEYFVRKCLVYINNKVISFSLKGRVKSLESMIGKGISSPTYYTADQMKDHIAITCKVESREDALLLMQYFDTQIYNGDIEIDQSNNMVQEDDLQNEQFTADFKESLNIALAKGHKKGKLSSDSRDVLKMNGKTKLPFEATQLSSLFEVGTEISFEIEGHDNEKGKSIHPIYDYGKLFRELTRLTIPIRTHDIINYTNEAFQKIYQRLEKINKTKEIFFEELKKDWLEGGFITSEEANTSDENLEKVLHLGLFRYYKSQLTLIQVGNARYYVSNRASELADIEMYPFFDKLKNEIF